VSDVTEQITALLMEAATLAIAADGSTPGKYALVVQSIVDPGGSLILNWERYGP
jgi:hypothetical protein